MASLPPNQAKQVATGGLETFPAKSSWIDSFEYDSINLRLTTHLKDGNIYQHVFVLPITWDALKTSEKHSDFWIHNVKGKFASIHVKKANIGHKPKIETVDDKLKAKRKEHGGK
jgi:hypothetical protein